MEQQEGEQRRPQQQGVVQVEPQPAAPAAPVAPQQCPRCNSRNTKFCYYNNYSYSQPRHLCKTCRRYWTHGGTLRNVPVGGGSRKGKRVKTSSSSSSTSSDNSQTLQKLVAENHLTPTATFYQGGGSGNGVAVGGAGGYLASLAALNQLNNPSMNYPFDPSLINLGGVGGAGGSGSSSNLNLFQGFNAGAFLGSSSSSASQRQNLPQQQFYQLGNGELLSLYNNSEQGLNLVNNVPSTMANNNNYTTSAASMLQTQSFMNGAATATSNSNNSIRAFSDASLWSTISTTNHISGANNTASVSGASASGASDAYGDGARARAAGHSSLAPNQWFDLQRFQPPPQ